MKQSSYKDSRVEYLVFLILSPTRCLAMSHEFRLIYMAGVYAVNKNNHTYLRVGQCMSNTEYFIFNHSICHRSLGYLDTPAEIDNPDLICVQ